MVQFHDDLVRHTAIGGGGADGGGGHDAAAVGDIAGLNHGAVQAPQVAVPDLLLNHGEVQVEKAHLARVDGFAEQREALVRRPETDGLGRGQRAVKRRPRGGAGQHSNAEIAPGLVFLGCAGGDGHRHNLCRARGRESAKPNGVAVLYEGGCFFGSQLL